jgi:CRISPR-associated protein Cmr3
MSAIEYRFLEPLDVLFLRGNKLFGDPGSFGESLVPPWPSVAAGALRSMLLAKDGVDLSAFAANCIEHPTLGTPNKPGSFAITSFQLAGRDERGMVSLFTAPPADLFISKKGDGELVVHRLRPSSNTEGIESSAPLPLLPVLAHRERSKGVGGHWLTQSGWEKYLDGTTPASGDLITSSELWQIDARVGVGLDIQTRRAFKGRLFSTQAVAMRKREHGRPGSRFDVGFLVGCAGTQLPASGVVRLGGDGRAAVMHVVTIRRPEVNIEDIVKARRCRLVLEAPGIFPEGWKLPSMDIHNHIRFDGVTARVVCAAVPRAEVISGWDLARGRPKNAQRGAPAGSVFWLDDLDATAGALRKLVENGLWTQTWQDPQRRAEGFNRFTIAAY